MTQHRNDRNTARPTGGNQSRGELRAIARLTPQERLRRGLTLSAFGVGLAAAGKRQRERRDL